MSEIDRQIREVELSIEEARAAVELRDALERLRENRDYKLVVEKGYFIDEPARMVMLRSEPHMQEDGQLQYLARALDGVGFYRQYERKIVQMGNMSEQAIRDNETTRQELLAEDLVGSH